ncbi:MAG: hypothetical protein R3F50_03800 [Gammaproteobacteria bacterium]
MKYLVILTGILSLLALAPNASADNRRWYGNDRHADYGYVRADRFRGNGFYRNRAPRHFNRHFVGAYRPYYGPYRGPYAGAFGSPFRGGSYWNLSVGRSYRHDRFDSGALLGGLVLGSVLGHGIASSQYRTPERVYVPTQSTRVIRRTPVSSSAVPQTRLLRDLSGRCYEIFQNGSGTETRVELDPSVCNF